MMVNPILTTLFDLFLVGSAVAVIAGMVREYRANRLPAIGTSARAPADRRPAARSHIAEYHARRNAGRRGQLSYRKA